MTSILLGKPLTQLLQTVSLYLMHIMIHIGHIQRNMQTRQYSPCFRCQEALDDGGHVHKSMNSHEAEMHNYCVFSVSGKQGQVLFV